MRNRTAPQAEQAAEVEVETVEPTEATEATEAAPKAPSRPPIPEGYVSPVGFAKALSEHLGKEIRPQIVYSYIKNASTDHPFPIQEVGGRRVLKVDEGLAWWDEHLKRVATRKANAAEKRQKKAERAKAKAEAAEAEGGEAVEAEITEAE